MLLRSDSHDLLMVTSFLKIRITTPKLSGFFLPEI